MNDERVPQPGRRREDKTALELQWQLIGHERLCTERYENLENKVDKVESAVSQLETVVRDDIKEVKENFAKMMWTLITGMATILCAILFKAFT